MKLRHDTSAGPELASENAPTEVTVTLTNPAGSGSNEAPAAPAPDDLGFFFPHKLRDPSVRGLSGRPVYVQLQGSNQRHSERPRALTHPNWDRTRTSGPTPPRGWLGFLRGLLGRSY